VLAVTLDVPGGWAGGLGAVLHAVDRTTAIRAATRRMSDLTVVWDAGYESARQTKQHPTLPGHCHISVRQLSLFHKLGAKRAYQRR
jgi:hypothetical protein